MAACATSRCFSYWRIHYENCRVVGRKEKRWSGGKKTGLT
jgi:hypothetical protein